MTDFVYAAKLVAHFEGFLPHAKWDVNAYRLGYGSDTEGPEQRKVTKGMITTEARALANLQARLPQFEKVIIKQVGGLWDDIPSHAKGALLSVAYNYGDLPENVVHAIKTGNLHSISAAVGALAGANHGINSHRRYAEAAIIKTS